MQLEATPVELEIEFPEQSDQAASLSDEAEGSHEVGVQTQSHLRELYHHIAAGGVYAHFPCREDCAMPEKETIKRARADKRQGKSASTQAGEFVHEEIKHVRGGKHGARSSKQAIAIGLSKARRAGVKLPAPPKGRASAETRASARRALAKGRSNGKPSARRSRAVESALKREGRSAASHTALSRQARTAARRRSTASRHKAALRAVRTKGPAGLHRAAVKAAHTRAAG
jgi:uncharacterized protein DUF6496